MLSDILLLPIIEVVLMGVLTGLVGALALSHRRIFFAESLTHATFPGAILGVVIAAWIASALGGQGSGRALLTPAIFVGAALICLPLIWMMRALAAIPGQSSQAAAGIILTFGFALGYFLNKWFSPLPLKVDSFLTGSLLNVGKVDVIALAIATLVTVLIIVLGGRFLTFYSFDSIGYSATGLRGRMAEAVILTLICLGIVVVIPAVGTILPIALIAAPAASLYPHVKSLNTLYWAAPLLGVAIGLAGLAVAVSANLSAGGSVALTAAIVYAGFASARAIRKAAGRPKSFLPIP